MKNASKKSTTHKDSTNKALPSIVPTAKSVSSVPTKSPVHPNRKTTIVSICLIIFLLFAFLGGRFALMKFGLIPADELKYSQEYLPETGNIKGNVDIASFLKKSPDYDIGANQYGYAVFKNPSKALNRLKRDCHAGLILIQKEFNLPPLSSFNFKAYKTYGWQTTTGTEEEQNQAIFVSSFMDIYENSFNQ